MPPPTSFSLRRLCKPTSIIIAWTRRQSKRKMKFNERFFDCVFPMSQDFNKANSKKNLKPICGRGPYRRWAALFSHVYWWWNACPRLGFANKYSQKHLHRRIRYETFCIYISYSCNCNNGWMYWFANITKFTRIIPTSSWQF